MTAPLSQWPVGQLAVIDSIRWESLGEAEGRRLRELGLFEGVTVTPRHRGSLFASDPLAIEIGRMRIIIRQRHAAAIQVRVVDGVDA